MDEVDGYGLRHATETATGQRGVLDLRQVGRVVFTPDGGEPRAFAWRGCKVVGGDLLRFTSADGDVRTYRDHHASPGRAPRARGRS